MSKNFELMQQAVMTRESTAESLVTPLPYKENALRRGGTGTLDLEAITREECLKFVQRVFLNQRTQRPQVALFAGIDRGNGCSGTCARFAETLANNTRESVCLIDANLRSPALPQYFGVPNHRGLTDALIEDGPINTFAKQLRPSNLWLVSCGSLSADAANILKSDRLKARIAEMRSEFGYILIDAPPLSQFADAAGLGQFADGVVLVLEANATRREAAQKVTDNLRAMNVAVLGAVLNKRTYPIPQALYQTL